MGRNSILTLPPIERKIVNVEFTACERHFYNALLDKSQTVFEGFISAGTASKSWLAIFSLLQRLRQACDHLSLTVKSHMQGEEHPTMNEDLGRVGEDKAIKPDNEEMEKNTKSHFNDEVIQDDCIL